MTRLRKRKMTINDLIEEDIINCRNKYISENIDILNQYFGYWDILILRQSFLSKLYSKISEIKVPEGSLTTSHFRFSRRHIIIPRIIEVVSDLLIKDDIKITEIFRLNSTEQKIKDLYELITDITSSKISEKQGMYKLTDNFNIIDIAGLYKTLFRRYNEFVLPRNVVRIALRIDSIVDLNHKRICTKTLLYALPRINRYILENCVYVCTKIARKLKKCNSRKKMNLNGLAIVMMPNIINPNQNDSGYENIKKLSSFISYLFQNFEEIIKIDD